MNDHAMIYNLFRRHQKVLKFVILNCGPKINQDIDQGIIKIRLFSDKISFVGKQYVDPKVTIKLADIESVEIQFNNKRQISGILVKAFAESVSYNHPPGPDF